MAVKPHSLETELLLRAAEGSERAFTELFYHYYTALARFVYKLTGSRELAEEIVQDAFVSIWLRREKLAQIDHFGKYLFAICRNGTFTALKKIAAEKSLQGSFEQYVIDEAALDLMDNPAEEYREIIAQAVAKLPEQQRRVYTMSRYDRLKYDEIAIQLGLSVTTVRKHVQLAVQFIQNDIAKKGISAGLMILLTTPLMWR
ncbi:RNA polymerase sigma-70 factor [Pararcticibacter amylolyticus]|uniref:RNA polymerase subunit sigma-24 n=1 Tax=Pararcticibacter amylolyticus TaxID=2173175 RepID=A0A2U2PHT6_9SPHI|nr:RNA polymerase sigma-70 factor [Pararcticibacter amylolyticus]PWG80824.1 RNA polymerase subunit sigma-24 [Pararcticibacter amylolyticus]